MLAKAIGYKGDARFISFHWTPYGDEVDYSDGRLSATGNWHAFLTYIQHPAIAPQLLEYNFGSSDSEATYALILDTVKLTFAVAPVKEITSISYYTMAAITKNPHEYRRICRNGSTDQETNETITGYRC